MATNQFVGRVLEAYNMQNVQIIHTNPYAGKINSSLPADKELYKSALGTPVLTDITFESVRYTNEAGQILVVPSITLTTVLITVSKPLNIVSTQIPGGKGTVKEYIGQGDATITINGILPGGNGRYPQSEVHALDRMLAAPVAKPVTCAYLQNLEIYNVVITEYSFTQEPGGYSQQLFSVNAIEDSPVELLIKNV
ncbi:DUF6046 domain-containing protein [Chitinophaga sp. Hz27]|uniref:DUF6046 domain-containing protein n=1 Tax=Chitinophaga sp. Hz27 TaxID=3347169 RepID=UPI0035D55BFE